MLLGAGLAHLQMLRHLAQKPLIGVRVVLVAPRAPIGGRTHSGLMAGRIALEDCTIALEPWYSAPECAGCRCGVHGLDANPNGASDEGEPLTYDWLSINTGPNHNREWQLQQAMPGVRTMAFSVRPIERFTALWPR